MGLVSSVHKKQKFTDGICTIALRCVVFKLHRVILSQYSFPSLLFFSFTFVLCFSSW